MLLTPCSLFSLGGINSRQLRHLSIYCTNGKYSAYKLPTKHVYKLAMIQFVTETVRKKEKKNFRHKQVYL